MYAWHEETGEGNDWDMSIALRVFAEGLEDMMAGSPDSELGIFSNGGDFCHWDGWDPVTPTNRHLLDADSRFPKLAEYALDCHIHAIERLLTKHRRVLAVIQEGNHDLASSVWLRKALKRIFANNPRVQIDDTELPFYAYQHGDTMLAWHHTHKVKSEKLPMLFASLPQYRKAWGDSAVAFIHCGHYHHRENRIDEFGGAIIERHPTLASPDAHAIRHGYVSRRAAHAITYDPLDGEVTRKTVVPRRRKT
jgi:hypothetical protein